MWIILAFISAFLLGLYDVSKKQALKGNAVLKVLLLNTIFSTILFSPVVLNSLFDLGWFEGTRFAVPLGSAAEHGAVFIKAVLVLISWICGYFGLKELPLTIAAPIHATRPVMTLVGAMIIFGERLNLTQWAGVLLAIASLFMLSRSGKKEGIDFRHNRGVLLVGLAAITGTCCGLYDRHIMHSLEPMFVQSWYTLYQAVLMSITIIILTFFKVRKQGSVDPFHWSWAIPLISLFLSAADVAYLFALSKADAMISVVSMIRRSSVLVSFTCGAILFHERNLKAKAFDLALIFIAAILLYIGSR
ncbi:MAG: DMT family transporter [Alistipes sp.]|nr:DMT family transporter [Alistipes sp.]MBQ9962472.1 DMT family transporter [Alistipes sp.]